MNAKETTRKTDKSVSPKGVPEVGDESEEELLNRAVAKGGDKISCVCPSYGHGIPFWFCQDRGKSLNKS